MGVSKPLALLGDRPLLAHALNSFQDSLIGEVIVVLGKDAERVRNEVPLGRAVPVLNPDYEDGMSTSIRTGIAAADPGSTRYLIALGDQPSVSSQTIDALLERWTPAGPKILVPTYRGARGNPVLLDRSLSAELAALSGDIGCRAIFGIHAEEILEVPVHDPGILFDIDTPEQLEALRKELERGRSLVSAVSELVSRESALRGGNPEGRGTRTGSAVVARDP